MLNIGLIGKTETLEPVVKRIRKNKNANIIGKSSVGGSNPLNSFHYSIPEMNKYELIERANILVIDNSSLLPFNLLGDIIKKSKHIFIAEYLDITVDECTQLVKLANESGSVIQVANPFLFTPAIQWLNKNISLPVYLDILDFTGTGENDEKMFQYALMLLGLTGISPKKVGAVTFKSAPDHSGFTNIRLEFGDASVVNLNIGHITSIEEFKIRAYSRNNFATLNFTKKIFTSNNHPINFTDFPAVCEFEWFTDTILQKNKKKSCLEDYLIAMHLVQKINKKVAQFFAQ